MYIHRGKSDQFSFIGKKRKQIFIKCFTNYKFLMFTTLT